MSDETQFGLPLQAIRELSGAMDGMRGEIMARLDRHGDELSAIHEDIIAPPITSGGATSTRTRSCGCSAIRSTGVAQHDLAHRPVAYALWSLNKLIAPLPPAGSGAILILAPVGF